MPALEHLEVMKSVQNMTENSKSRLMSQAASLGRLTFSVQAAKVELLQHLGISWVNKCRLS